MQSSLKNLKVSDSEAKCLEILSNNDMINAYEIWKLSDYKHYPTILRAIKKLKNKGFVDESVQEVFKNATYYTINLGGELFYYFISENYDNAFNLLKKDSEKFKIFYDEFCAVIGGTYTLFNIFERIILLTIKNEKCNIEQEIEKLAEGIIAGYLNDLVNALVYDEITYENDILQSIVKISKKYKWIYDLNMKGIESSQDWSRNMYEAYTKIRSMIERSE